MHLRGSGITPINLGRAMWVARDVHWGGEVRSHAIVTGSSPVYVQCPFFAMPRADPFSICGHRGAGIIADTKLPGAPGILMHFSSS